MAVMRAARVARETTAFAAARILMASQIQPTAISRGVRLEEGRSYALRRNGRREADSRQSPRALHIAPYEA